MCHTKFGLIAGSIIERVIDLVFVGSPIESAIMVDNASPTIVQNLRWMSVIWATHFYWDDLQKYLHLEIQPS